MPRRPVTLPIGTISEGTLRTEDLLSAYADYCRDYGGKDGKKLAREYDNLPAEDDQTDDQQEQAGYLLEEMTTNLEEHTPDYCYFGSLEGDGAHFGVWPSMDSLEEATSGKNPEVLKVNDLDQLPRQYRGYVMHVNDHGNVTLYWKNRQSLREIWSVV